MAVIAMDGFDHYNGIGANTGLAARWIVNIGDLVTVQTGRLSGRAIRFGGWANNTLRAQATFALPSSYSTLGVGFAFQVPDLSRYYSSINDNYLFWMADTGGTTHIVMRINSTGQIALFNNSTQLGITLSGTVRSGSWHFIEIGTVISDTVGELILKVDGVTHLNLTNIDTRNAGTGLIDRLVYSGGINNGDGLYLIDDLYVVDSKTTLGERRINTLVPNSDVAQVFARSTGAQNFALVDELPVTTTDFVTGSNVGDTDRYGFTDITSNATTINAVQVFAYAQKTDAATRAIALQLYSGTTAQDGPTYNLNTSTSWYGRIVEQNPDGSVAWTPTTVNALQGGPKVIT